MKKDKSQFGEMKVSVDALARMVAKGFVRMDERFDEINRIVLPRHDARISLLEADNHEIKGILKLD